jgi:dihydroorotase
VLTRRIFLQRASVAGVAAVAAGRRLFAAKYDLVIKGGRVIDPGARQVAMRDVGIGGGRIIAVEANLTAADAASTIDATVIAFR